MGLSGNWGGESGRKIHDTLVLLLQVENYLGSLGIPVVDTQIGG